jgi:hypothetical protein
MRKTPLPKKTSVFQWFSILLHIWKDFSNWRRMRQSEKLTKFIEAIELTAFQQPQTTTPPTWVFNSSMILATLLPSGQLKRCFIRCLWKYYLLLLARQPAIIHFGCRLDRTGFSGHCWLSSPCRSLPKKQKQLMVTQAVFARVYGGSEKGVRWQSFYS